MPVAYNQQTGQALRYDGNQWVPTNVASNKQTGEMVAYDGANWSPIKAQQKTTTGDRIGMGLRGMAQSTLQGTADLAEQSLRIPDLIGYGLTSALGMDKAAGSYKRDLSKPMPSDVAIGAMDKATGDRYVPQTDEEKYIDTVNQLGAGLMTGGPLVSSGTQSVVQGTKNTLKNRRTNFLQDLVLPKATPNESADQFSRSTEKGLLNSRVLQPNSQEAAMAQEVGKLKVSPMNSLLKNYNIIGSEVKKEANTLASSLAKKNIQIEEGTIDDALSKAYEDTASNIFLTGDGADKAARVIQKAKELIAEEGNTAHGILNARKRLDHWVTSQRGGRIWDADRENPVTLAVGNIRRAMNGVVSQAAPEEQVIKSLGKQSTLLDAMDNIASKGASEGKNIITRGAKKVGNVLSTKAALGTGAAALGGGYLLGR